MLQLIRVGFLSLIIFFIAVFVWQVSFNVVVKPWEINREIHSGCETVNAFNKIKAPTEQQWVKEGKSFSRLARLDPRYIELETSAVLYAFAKGNASQLPAASSNFVANAQVEVEGFCARK